MSAKIEKYPGKPLRSEDIKQGKVLYTTAKGKFRYAWAAGVAIGRFLEELKKGKIVGRKCLKCNRILVPPRMFCETCFRETDEWVNVKDTGKINTYSISHVATDASRVDEPILVAVIEIDGASEGMGFMHLLGEVDPDQVKIGMEVKAVWKPPNERVGAITDIEYFKPITEEVEA